MALLKPFEVNDGRMQQGKNLNRVSLINDNASKPRGRRTWLVETLPSPYLRDANSSTSLLVFSGKWEWIVQLNTTKRDPPDFASTPIKDRRVYSSRSGICRSRWELASSNCHCREHPHVKSELKL